MSNAPKNVDAIYPLSPMQYLMLVHALSSGDAVLANQVVYDLRGPLDAERFRRAWQTLVNRHPALRTAFLWEGLERPVQVVRTQVDVPFEWVDLSGLSPDEQSTRTRALIEADRDAPFTLQRAPLMRCTLVRQDAGQHVFIWNVHHLVADRWSHGLLFDELVAAYGQVSIGAKPLVSAPAFGTYIDWVGNQNPQEATAYWRDQLEGFTTPTLLTTQRPTRTVRSTHHHVIDAEVVREIERRAGGTGTTLSSWIQAALAVAVARRCNHRDVVYGLTVSGRPAELADADRIVGSFVNNVPARVRFAPGRSVLELVRSIQLDQIKRARFEHASLVEISTVGSTPPGVPLFDLLILINVAFGEELVWPEFDVRARSATLDAGYPLLLACTLRDGALVLDLVHGEDLDGASAQALLNDVDAGFADLSCVEPTDSCLDLIAGVPEAAAAVTVPLVPNEPEIPASGDRARQLLGIWRSVLGQSDIGVDDDFFALGGSSLQAAQLFIAVERALGRSLPLSTLFRAGTVRALMRELDEPLPESGTLVALRATGVHPPLYAVPGIGGNVVGLAGLARELEGHPFYGLMSRGLDGEESPLQTIQEIAEDHARAVAAQARAPIDLLGVCWGAAVAFEMVEKLEQLGCEVRSLALLDPAVLLRQEEGAPNPDASFVKKRLELYWDEFRGADWRGRGRFLVDKAKRAAGTAKAGGLAEESRTERNQRRVLAANRGAVSRYRPSAIRTRACVFITEDRDVHGADPRLEWCALLEPRPEVVVVPGTNSGDAIAPAHVSSFAEVLAAWLQGVRQPT